MAVLFIKKCDVSVGVVLKGVVCLRCVRTEAGTEHKSLQAGTPQELPWGCTVNQSIANEDWISAFAFKWIWRVLTTEWNYEIEIKFCQWLGVEVEWATVPEDDINYLEIITEGIFEDFRNIIMFQSLKKAPIFRAVLVFSQIIYINMDNLSSRCAKFFKLIFFFFPWKNGNREAMTCKKSW